MQPKKTKNEVKQQKIKEKREDKNEQQLKTVQGTSKPGQKFKEAIEQVLILNEPLKF